jgi:hypothetical protein
VLVEQRVRPRHFGGRIAAESATNSAPVSATSRAEAVSLPASTMQGISIMAAHQRPSVRLRECGSGLLS